ncbi:major facilitator superfamily domain-containing protein [Terfezia claveryi]|nr:major facilitator superfamily domain-containing protein [Terfezia claveryi]
MGLGIREPRGGGHVPGTVKLFESDSVRSGPALEENVEPPFAGRFKKSGEGGVTLVPQPSDSPNDPLNWPLWKKDLTLLTICFSTAVGCTLGPALAPVNAELTVEFNTSFTTVYNWTGYQFLASGMAGLLCEVVARFLGRRPIYLLSTIFMFAGALWNSLLKSPDVGGFVGARVLQGVGLGAFETLVITSIGDMYFVHERGKRIAFYNLLFFGVTYFTPVLSGYITAKHGWRMQFRIMAGLFIPALVMLFLFCPEHAFVRDRKFETDLVSESSSTASVNVSEEKQEIAVAAASMEPKKTFWQELKVYNGRFSTDGFWKLLVAPFPAMLYPAAIWVFLFQGTFVTWGIAVSMVLAQMFSAPPYNFNPTEMGYIYASPTIGALLAYIVCMLTYDRLCIYLTKRNNFTYEPEFRILFVIPVLLTGIPGLIAYGYATTTPGLHWIIPSILYGMLTFAVVVACIVTYSYILDAHRELSVEMMVAVLLVKNFFSWGSTFYLADWLVEWGARNVFLTMGLIQAVICVGSVVIYIYGKVWRAMMVKIKLLERLGLKPGMMRR